MAVEQIRGCGYRQVGGLYLVGSGIWVECDRLPFPIGSCPVCGQGIHFARAFMEINPLKLFGLHDLCGSGWLEVFEPTLGESISVGLDTTGRSCQDPIRPCSMCDPRDEPAYVMIVGNRYYTPESFMKEAMELGVSKRIPFIPKGLKLGQTIVYLAHPKAIEIKESVPVEKPMTIIEYDSQLELLKAQQKSLYSLGIFMVFTPQRVERLIWESEATPETLKDLGKRGITPVVIPGRDPDHQPKQKTIRKER